MPNNPDTPRQVPDYDGPDHDGIRASYLQYQEQVHRRVDEATRRAGPAMLPFAEWLLAQPSGWLAAFGVRTVDDVKLTIATWREWCMHMRHPARPKAR